MFFYFGNDVTVDYIVDGNLVVFANNVTISSQIGGDAFIDANTVTLTNQSYVFSNLFTIAQTVNINGVVYDVYSSCKSMNVSGYIYRDIKAQAQTFNLNGSIGRNAFVSSNDINFNNQNNSQNDSTTIASTARVGGDFNYNSSSEISIEEGIVSGNVNYSSTVTSQNLVIKYAISLIAFVLTVIVIWLLCLWLAPKFLEKSYKLITKKPFGVIGIGILVPIVIIIASILLMLLMVTANLSAILISILLGAILISKAIFIIVLNKLVCNKLNLSKKHHVFFLLLLLSIILWALTLIPYVSTVIDIIAIIIGLGIVFSSIFIKNIDDHKKEKKDNKKSKESK